MKAKRTIKMPLRRPAAKPRSARPKLRARAAAAEPDYDLDDYEGSNEPSMRFSHALFVVLILHVIAVAGVFAFNSIKARQTAATGEIASSPAAAVPRDEVTSGPRTHTVAPGDTLTRIAARYGTTVRALEKQNAITTYSTIRVGQVLRIPEGAAPEPASPHTAQATAKSLPAAPPAAKVSSAPKPAAASATPIPARVIASVPPGAAPAAPVNTMPADGTYKVEKGDNPYSIARKFGVSYQKLIEINQIDDPTKVQIGQVLKLPGNTN